MYPQENKKNIEIHEGYKQVYILNISLHKAYYLHDQKMADEVQTQ